MIRTLDRRKARVRPHEARYSRSLRQVAKQIGVILGGFEPMDDTSIEKALRLYASAIEDWAVSVGARMLLDVKLANDREWSQLSQSISKGLRQEILNAPTGDLFRQLQAEQVILITSLPLDAAERVQKLAAQARLDSSRASTLVAEIMRSGYVAESRAMCIARTETSRAGANLTQARAEWVGSTGYTWRITGDSDVRPSHKAMDGKFVLWGQPPTLDGMTGHAGCVPNCRCSSIPQIPD